MQNILKIWSKLTLLGYTVLLLYVNKIFTQTCYNFKNTLSHIKQIGNKIFS